MSTDLRGVPAEDYWQRFNAMVNGDGGLLTYRYLGRKTAMLHGEAYDTMRIRRDMRAASGAIMAAPLAIASAEAGGFSDVDSIPAPVTAALHIIDDGLGVTEIAMRRTPIHVGRTMGFSQCEIVDAANPLAEETNAATGGWFKGVTVPACEMVLVAPLLSVTVSATV